MKTTHELPPKFTDKGKWICACPSSKSGGYVDNNSLSYTRTDSIKKFVRGSKWKWNWWRRRGWRCVRVNITYEIQIKS